MYIILYSRQHNDNVYLAAVTGGDMGGGGGLEHGGGGAGPRARGMVTVNVSPLRLTVGVPSTAGASVTSGALTESFSGSDGVALVFFGSSLGGFKLSTTLGSGFLTSSKSIGASMSIFG